MLPLCDGRWSKEERIPLNFQSHLYQSCSAPRTVRGQSFSRGVKKGWPVISRRNRRLSAITFLRSVPSRNLWRLSNGCRPDKVSLTPAAGLWDRITLLRVVLTSRKPKLYTAKWWMTSLAFRTPLNLFHVPLRRCSFGTPKLPPRRPLFLSKVTRKNISFSEGENSHRHYDRRL